MRLTRVVYAPPRIDGSGFVSTPHLPQHSRALEIRRSRAHGRRWPSAQIRPYALVRRPVPPRVMGKWPLCAYSLAVVASGGQAWSRHGTRVDATTRSAADGTPRARHRRGV